MSEERLVSIIIPVYNVENYLSDCLESVICQTYSNLEILLINDGSTDDSKSICLEYLKKDKRIRYFEKPNSGLSDTRNLGLSKVKGEYIMFVDSDDLISKNIVKQLVALSETNHTEISSCKISHFSINDTPVFSDGDTYLLQRNEAICDFLYQKNISTSACGKLYTTKVIRGLFFPSGMHFEDNLFVAQALSRVSSVSVTNGRYYAYRHRDNSITTSKFSIKDFDVINIGKMIMECYNTEENCIKKALIAYQTTNCLRIVLTAPREDKYKTELDYCHNFLKENCNDVLKDSSIRIKLKYALFIYKTFPFILLLSIHKRMNRWN